MRIRTLSLLFVVAFGAACGAGGENAAVAKPRFPVSVPRAGIVALPESATTAALAQCSRKSLDPEVRSWAVSSAELEGLEAILMPILERALEQNFEPGSPMDERYRGVTTTYFVQAVGVELRGRRMVYLNGFIASTIRDYRDTLTWRREPVVACDGGEGYFGAVFDPSSKSLGSLTFNGRG